MANRDDSVLRLLSPALEAARAALRDREPDAVPAGLRRVVAATGKRLPPPLAVALLDALDEQSDLRVEALGKWAEADVDSAVIEVRVSARYLQRPPGWSRTLAHEVASLTARQAQLEFEQLQAANIKLTDQIKEAKKRLKNAKAAAKAEAARLGQAAEAARREAAARHQAADGLIEMGASADQSAKLAASAEALVRSNATATDLARRLRAARRERAEALRQLAAGGGRLTRDPLEVARRLDAMASMGARERGDRDVAMATVDGLELPAGIRPDTAEAVDHIITRRTPTRLIVDGHNMLFRLGNGIAVTARDKLNHDLVRLRRLAEGPLSVTVVYDSALPGPRDVVRSIAGLDVIYSSEDVTADDEIVELIADVPAVVVTDDRLLRERVERRGAMALWAAALADWLRR